MLKSLLIGLDGSEDGRSVLELGLRWAKRFDALAVGLAVVDEPGILTSRRCSSREATTGTRSTPRLYCSPIHASESSRSCGNSPGDAARPA